jgi:hypothetical protein
MEEKKGVKVTQEGGTMNIEFQIDELVSRLVPSPNATCGGCNLCAGCSHPGCKGCKACGGHAIDMDKELGGSKPQKPHKPHPPK